MKSLLLTVLLLLTVQAFAQPQWRWGRRDPAANYSINPGYPRQVVAAFNGKSFWGNIQGNKVSYGQMIMGDYSFQEFDSAGNTLASAFATGKFGLLQARADAAGNWYCLGRFYDTIALGPSMRLTRAWAGTEAEYFLFRLHAGTLAPDWLQAVGSNYFCSAACFTIANGQLLLPMDSSFNTHMYKYDLATGAPTRLWTQVGRSQTADIQADSLGNIYLTGSCVLNGALNFNGTASTAPSGSKYPWYIARYHANGQHHWHYYMTDISCFSRGFRLYGNNEVYLTGLLADSTSLAGFTFSKPANMFNADYLMARLDSNGTLVWAQQRPVTSITQGGITFGTAFHTAIVDTVLYMMCESQGASIWGPGISTNTNGKHLATLVSYSKNTGNALWVKTIDGLYTGSQHLITDGNSIWTTGNGMDSFAIRLDTVSIAATRSVYIPYVAKMDIKPRPSSGPSLAVGNIGMEQIRIWPNPASQYVVVEGLSGQETLCIRDMTGRVVMPVATSNSGRLKVQTGALARGIYLLDVTGKDQRTLSRLVLE